MKGSLSRGVLPGLLRELFVGHRTGLLHVTRESERRSVRFQDGRIVGAHASDPEDQLGPVLVRQGFLAQADFDRARDLVARENKRLGRVLRDLGVWDAAKAEEALAIQAREILLKLFSWKDGTYVFEETGDQDVAEGETTPKLSTGQLILDAARRVDDYPVVHQALGDLDRVLILPADALLRFQNMMLTPADGYVLSRVDGEMTAREVLQVTPFSPEEAEKSLFCLLCTGALEYEARPVTGAAPPATTAPPKPSAAPPPVVAAAAPPPPAPPPRKAPSEREMEARRREVLEKCAGLSLKSHFEVLEIERGASADEVKEAYFRLARRYHPDSREAGLDEVKDKVDALFVRVSEAYDVLRSARTRANYEAALKARTPAAPAPAPVAAPAPAPEDPAERTKKDTEALRKAEKLLGREQYWEVIQLLEGVVARLAGKQKQRGRMALGRAYLKNPNWVKEGEELIRAVVAEDPGHVEACVLLGQVYKERGLRARALNMLRKALEADPENETAARELAGLEPEEEPPPAPEAGGGLIKKLFGRS